MAWSAAIWLDHIAAIDRLHGDPGLGSGLWVRALAHLWEPLSGGDTPHQRLTTVDVQKSLSTSRISIKYDFFKIR